MKWLATIALIVVAGSALAADQQHQLLTVTPWPPPKSLSQPPAPSGGKVSQEPQNQPASEQQKPAEAQRGTEQAPFIIEIPRTVQIHGDSDNAPQQSNEKSSPKWWPLFADWSTDQWLTIFTGALVLVGLMQLAVFRRQAIRLKETIDKMDEIATQQTVDTAALLEVTRNNVTATQSLATSSEQNIT
jgi:hypothetical protein